MRLENEEDTPFELEAAGQVELVEDSEMEQPTSLFDFRWAMFDAASFALSQGGSRLLDNLENWKYFGATMPVVPLEAPLQRQKAADIAHAQQLLFVSLLLRLKLPCPLRCQLAGLCPVSSIVRGMWQYTYHIVVVEAESSSRTIFFNYGRREEEDEEFIDFLPFDDQRPTIPTITTRMRLENEEDAPFELEAAGQVELVEDSEMAAADKSVDFRWAMFDAAPICPVSRRGVVCVGQCGRSRRPIASSYEVFVSIWDAQWNHIVQQPNQYAQEYAAHYMMDRANGPNSRINRWRDTKVR
ncbi:hypothetical protein evm_014114 [Chilo suppressalis]|nr:hypothetical protein evm_014114 [Chilo suppressalis]